MNPIRTAFRHNLQAQRHRYLAAHGMRATLEHELEREDEQSESIYVDEFEPREDFGE